MPEKSRSNPAFESRRERLSCEANRLALDGILVFSWRRRALQWLTGYWPGFASNWAALWQPTEGPAKLGVRFEFDVERAREQTGLTVATVGRPLDLIPEGTRRIGLISGDQAIDEAPPSLLTGLVASGVEYIPLNDRLDQWRAVPSSADLDALRWATAKCNEAFHRLGRNAPAGASDFEIAAEIESFLRRHGMERVLCLTGVGNGAIVTEPDGAIIGSADVLSLEVTVHGSSVCVQTCHTLGPKKLSAASIATRREVGRCRSAIMSRMIPGRPISKAVDAGLRVLEASGLRDTLEYDFGHGIGVDTPEHPRLRPGSTGSFIEHSVVVVHVALRDERRGSWFEGGPVLVRESGPVELLPDMCWTLGF